MDTGLAGSLKWAVSKGTLSPANFGKTTIWQLRHLYGFSGSPPGLSQREAFLKRCKVLKLTAFETWERWQLVRPDRVVASEQIDSESKVTHV